MITIMIWLEENISHNHWIFQLVFSAVWMSFQPSEKYVSCLVRKAVLVLYYVIWLVIGPMMKKIGDYWVIEITIFDKWLLSDWNHFFSWSCNTLFSWPGLSAMVAASSITLNTESSILSTFKHVASMVSIWHCPVQVLNFQHLAVPVFKRQSQHLSNSFWFQLAI